MRGAIVCAATLEPASECGPPHGYYERETDAARAMSRLARRQLTANASGQPGAHAMALCRCSVDLAVARALRATSVIRGQYSNFRL